MCFHSFPNSKGILIAELEEGDEVVLKIPGESDVTTHIWQKDGYSALTASGHILSCQSDIEFEVTGNHADQFEISAEATKIQEKIASRQAYEEWADFSDDPLDAL